MRVVALHEVPYDGITYKQGDEFTMQDDHVFPFEVMGHVKRLESFEREPVMPAEPSAPPPPPPVPAPKSRYLKRA